MRGKKVFLLAVAACVFLGAAVLTETLAQTTQAKPPAAIRIAVCNVVKVVQNYRSINDLNVLLQKKQQALQAEEEKRVKSIDAAQAELGQLAEGSAEYDKRLEDLLNKKGDLKAWKETQDALLRKWHYLCTRQMFEEVLKAVEAVAKEQGYQLVLFKEPADLTASNTGELVELMIARRKVLYSDDSLDITEPVLTRLNLSYTPPTTKP